MKHATAIVREELLPSCHAVEPHELPTLDESHHALRDELLSLSAFVDDLYVRYARLIQPVPTVDVDLLLSRVDALLERLAELVESGVERRLPARVFVGAERTEATLSRERGEWLIALDSGVRFAVHFDAVSLSGRQPMAFAREDDGDLDGPDDHVLAGLREGAGGTEVDS
jgi:hypothetical protein